MVIHYLLKDNYDYKKSTCKHNDGELNRILLDIFGRQDELTSEAEEKDVVDRKDERQQDIHAFISCAVY